MGYHNFIVKVFIISVTNNIRSQVIESSIPERPIGMILSADLNGEDPYDFHIRNGWYCYTDSALGILVIK